MIDGLGLVAYSIRPDLSPLYLTLVTLTSEGLCFKEGNAWQGDKQKYVQRRLVSSTSVVNLSSMSLSLCHCCKENGIRPHNSANVVS